MSSIPSRSKVFALVDCNNFFVSCERVFQPNLNGKPVVVASNNDGCVIARSNEAKAIGIKMGEPLFKAKDIVTKHNVIIMSSNFSLYGDMSNRVMNVLSQLANNIEFYSVDEAFLDLSFIPPDRLEDYAKYIRNTINQWLGLPVSIGIGSSKTLAKAAAFLAKKSHSGVICLDKNNCDQMLVQIPVAQIWGIGRSYIKLLEKNHIYTALELKNMGVNWGRQHMAVHGGRLIEELNGNCAYDIGNSEDSRKSITVSRTFHDINYQWPSVKTAIASFVEKACEKLRLHELAAKGIIVFVNSNRFQENYYTKSHLINLPIASEYTPDLLTAANRALQHIYKPGIGYKRAGITLVDLEPRQSIQLSLFDKPRNGKTNQVIKYIDKINSRYGTQTVTFGSLNFNKSSRYKRKFSSPRFTTSWNELVKVA